VSEAVCVFHACKLVKAILSCKQYVVVFILCIVGRSCGNCNSGYVNCNISFITVIQAMTLCRCSDFYLCEMYSYTVLYSYCGDGR